MTDKRDPRTPSDELMNAICLCGTPVATCGFCGMTTFGLGGRDMDEGEYEEYCAKVKTNPAKYREDPENDSIAVGEFGGCTVVWGCPCNGVRKYEDFIWSHRHVIIDYLKRRAKLDLAEAKSNAELMEVIHAAE